MTNSLWSPVAVRVTHRHRCSSSFLCPANAHHCALSSLPSRSRAEAAAAKGKAVEMEDIRFHQCVRLSRYAPNPLRMLTIALTAHTTRMGHCTAHVTAQALSLAVACVSSARELSLF